MLLTILSNQGAPPPKTFWIKIAGTWRTAISFVKISGVWKQTTPYVKVGGIWR